MNALEIIPGVYEDTESRATAETREMSRPKYGSFIRDLEESIATRDWMQVEKDMAALAQHHDRVIAGRAGMTNPSAAELAELNQRIPHTCPVCGVRFTALKIARYCSNRCRQTAKRQMAAGDRKR